MTTDFYGGGGCGAGVGDMEGSYSPKRSRRHMMGRKSVQDAEEVTGIQKHPSFCSMHTFSAHTPGGHELNLVSKVSEDVEKQQLTLGSAFLLRKAAERARRAEPFIVMSIHNTCQHQLRSLLLRTLPGACTFSACATCTVFHTDCSRLVAARDSLA